MTILDQIASSVDKVEETYGWSPVSVYINKEIYNQLNNEAKGMELHTFTGSHPSKLSYINGMEIRISQFLDKSRVAFYSREGKAVVVVVNLEESTPVKQPEKSVEKKYFRLIRI